MRRIRLSEQPVCLFDEAKVAQQEVDHKPHGLWYAFNDAWIEWCKGEMPSWMRPYIHEVFVDESKLIRITNEQELDAFEAKYGVRYHDLLASGGPDRIDWPRVAEEFAGFEAVP